MASYDYITKTATKPARHWTNRNVLRFEYFNPNGIVARRYAVSDKVFALVEAGKAKSGALLVYGICDSYSYEKMQEMIGKKKVSRIDLYVAIEMMEREIEKAEEFIAKIEG